jgi:hypothetical protein
MIAGRAKTAVRLVLLTFVATLAVSHSQSGHDPDVVLEQARVRLQKMARSLEKYVCIETVDRNYYRRVAPRDAPARPEADPSCGPADAGGPLQLESTDRVRFEVTESQGRELHSWPGATRFDARDVDELVRDGPVSTGAFGSYLASVFDQPAATFRYIGTQTANGKTVFAYQFRVSLGASRYEVRVGAVWRPTGYEGEFQLDPQSLELERLTIRTSELPPGADFCAAAATLDYEHVHIGGSDVLLPRQSQLEIALHSGRETRNVTRFANCREYQAESEIVFGDLSEIQSAAVPGAGRNRLPLPIGLPVTLALAGPIDTAVAAAGDAVVAKLVKPVRLPGSAEDLIPAGAVVHGHIRRVEHHLSPAPYFLIAMAFNRVDVHGVVSPFMVRREAGAEQARELGATLAMPMPGVRFWGVGTFLFPTKKSNILIPAGFESKWFTMATGGR